MRHRITPARRRSLGDVLNLDALQNITGTNIPVDAAHIAELQKQINRFSDPKSPLSTSLTTPLPVTGVLDDATALRALMILMVFANIDSKNVGDALAYQGLMFATPATRIQWVSDRITTAYTTIKAFGDKTGLPGVGLDIPMPILVGAIAVAAWFLFSSSKKGRKR